MAILSESRTLFARLSNQANYILSEMAGSRWFDGLLGIRNLGDVFHYDPSEPDHIRVRVHNSHFDASAQKGVVKFWSVNREDPARVTTNHS